MLTIEKTASVTHEVTEDVTAVALGSGSLPVLGTPALAAWMEEAACRCLDGELEEGTTSVGTALHLRHLAATPVGMTVTCTATLTAVEGRVLTYRITATDGVDTVGEADHQRVLVYADRFVQKAQAKKEYG